jgi:ketosteroid isomerase-like protein
LYRSLQIQIGLVVLGRALPRNCIEHFQEGLNMDNKQIVTKLVECWNTGKLGIVDEVFSENFIRHEPDIDGGTTNRDAYKQTVTRYHERLANFHTEATDIIEQGNKVAFRFKTTGKSGNAPVVFEGANILRIEGGKVAENWVYFDATGVKNKIKQQKAA